MRSIAHSRDARPVDGAPHTFLLPDFGRRTFLFPTAFLDSLAVTAVFPCDLRAAVRELAGTGLTPLPIVPRRTCAVVTAYLHRRVAQMSAYREVVILVPARREGSRVWPLVPLWMPSPPRDFGHAPLAMPVDSKLNCARGVAIWGLPKYLADIAVDAAPGDVEVQVAEAGRTALRFVVPARGRSRFIDIRTRLWCRAGATCATQRGEALVRTLGTDFSRVVAGMHFDPGSRVGGLLSRLGASVKALEARVAHHLEMKLDLPVQLLD